MIQGHAMSTQTATDDLLSKLQAIPAPSPEVGVGVGEAASTTVGPALDAGSWASVYGFELPRDEQIALLLMQGKSRARIAKELEIGPPTVYRLVQTPKFIASFRQMQEEMRESTATQQARIELLCSVSLDNIANTLFNSTDEELKIKTSLAVLDRGGHSVKQQAVITQKFEIDEASAALISKSMDELREAKTEIIEVAS